MKKMSLRKSHLVSYIGITVSTCLIVGILVLLFLNIQTTKIKRNEYMTKMNLAIQDLDTQKEIMELISFKVKINPAYRPIYGSRNVYYDLEIIDEIAKFQDYSPIVNEYYCLLSYNNTVYSPKGTIQFSEFVKYMINVSDKTITKEDLITSNGFNVIKHPTLKNTVIMIMPISIATNEMNACLIYFVRDVDLKNRIKQASSLPTDNLILYWNDVKIFGDGSKVSDKLLNVISGKSGFRLYSTASDQQIFPQKTMINAIYMMAIMTLTIIFAVISLLWGKKSYYPYDGLIKKLNIPIDSNIYDIEQKIKTLQDTQHYGIEEFNISLQKIASQRQEIAKRLLLFKLHIDQDNKMDDLMAEAGILLTHSFYCVLVIRNYNSKFSEGQISKLVNSICDEEISIYNAGLYESSYFLLILNFSAYGQEKEVQSVLQESLNEEDVRITVGDIVDDSSRIYLSLVSALTEKDNFNDEKLSESVLNWYDDKNVYEIMEAIKEGDQQKADTYLEELISMLNRQFPSSLFQQCIYMDIINVFMKTLHEINIDIEDKDLYKLINAANNKDFKMELKTVMDNTIKNVKSKKEQLDYNIINYINAQFNSNEFSIYKAAECFNISERKIGYIVKKITGKPYKDYIIYLRIERAKILLTEKHYNVSQAGEDVGYNNIPYFIKTFRRLTGYTPGEYKKEFERYKE